MRSQLGRAKGLGAAHSGLHHWWAQRVTAIALLPLSLYFVYSVLALSGASRADMVAFMAAPWNVVLYLCLIFALFYHLSLGVQVVIEDYVNNEASRMGGILLVKGAIWFCALACAVSVLKLAF
ncbi:MAG: succinate dehydrogenase, hydrophobic membrane anchor protein [Acidocella sp. 20-61-6]|nr:MAG: succinate dehydrogenase, hydrophobic membrane anchor protein [Acidocella sp. 20-61-6]